MKKNLLSIYFLGLIVGMQYFSYILKGNSFQEDVITNYIGPDGFGSQFHDLIGALFYAELNNKKFVYNPFQIMEHNYDNDPKYIEKKEWLINFKNNFELFNEPKHLIEKKHYKNFIDENITVFFHSLTLKQIRKIFRENKNCENYYKNNNLNIAIHIRRPNAHDNRIAGADTPDDFFLQIIKRLREIYISKNPIFHIYSQGKLENFKKFIEDDIILHLNDSVEDTFISMVFADILITAISALSYTAGILSEGIIYYIPFWHNPLPNWISTDILLNDQNTPKLKYNLVFDLPDIYLSSISEKIGVTWSNGNVWDKPLIQKFYSLLKNHNDFFVALDIGAQTGSFTLLAKYFPNSKWYSFEPIKEVAAILKDNLILNDIWNVSIVPMALANFSGSAILKMPSISDWGLATIGANVLRFTPVIEKRIDCIDLDSFIQDKNIKKVNFIKIDTEGSEFHILQGAKKLIKRDHPIILMEYNETNMKQCNIYKYEIDNFLTEMGYKWELISSEDILCIPIINRN